MKYTILILLIFFGTQPTLKADVKRWTLEQVGFLNIDRNEKDYGGFSGLLIKNAGTEALVVTDKSFFFFLILIRYCQYFHCNDLMEQPPLCQLFHPVQYIHKLCHSNYDYFSRSQTGEYNEFYLL